MDRKRILAIEDEEDILELLRVMLVKNGFDAICAPSGELALQFASLDPPDLIVLDLMLPGIDGLEVGRMLKTDPKTSHVPIVILTAKGDESDILKGFEMGADDYVTKPFSPKVLISRVKAVLGRSSSSRKTNLTRIEIKNLVIDQNRHEVLVNGKTTDLTFTEFKILLLLAGDPGRAFTRYQIIDAVRGKDYIVTDRAIDVQINGLRRKLGTASKYIETVRGVGYRFKD